MKFSLIAATLISSVAAFAPSSVEVRHELRKGRRKDVYNESENSEEEKNDESLEHEKGKDSRTT